MKNESRRHHYISQFYLKGFAKHGSKNPQITVINKHEKRHFKTTSKNLASIYDFNRIEIEGVQPDAFENELAKFESKAAHAMRSLHKNKKFEGENRVLILELIAMFAIRNPSIRNNIAGFLTNVKKTSLLTLLRSKPELKEGLILLIQKVKPEKRDNISDDDIKKFVDEDIIININTAYHLHTESVMIETILNLLNKRKWTLLQSPGNPHPFITSDMPVVLCWENPEEVPAMYRFHPGFGLPNTVVYFPLSQNLALIGKFDGEDVIAPPNETLVAASNTMQIMHAKNQLYMPHTDFDFLTTNEGIQKGKRLLE
jgi:hypothetical protein